MSLGFPHVGEYGKYYPFYGEASTVNIWYFVDDEKEFISKWYTIVQGKLYTFTFWALTVNSGEELATIMDSLVKSVEIHPQGK